MILISAIAVSKVMSKPLGWLMPTILFCGYLYVFKGKFKYLSGNKKGLKWPFLLS